MPIQSSDAEFQCFDSPPTDRRAAITVLVVDDSAEMRDRTRLLLELDEETKAYRVIDCESVAAALGVLSETPIQAVILDKNLGPDPEDPNDNGIESIPRFLELQPHLQILIVTGSNDHQDTVRAIKLGAYGYVTKDSPGALVREQLKAAIRYARLVVAKAIQELEKSPVDNDSASQPPALAGSSRSFGTRTRPLFAQNNYPLLILGKPAPENPPMRGLSTS